MKLVITLQPEDDKRGSIVFDVDVPVKHFNIIKESARLVASVTEAVKSIAKELGEE
ncbi:MAG: hypothetical protein V3U97_04115 [bacterium]